MQNNTIIKVDQLRKVYGSITAVENISFVVKKGEIFGMVGPNGAGKTTTIECIEGLRNPDSGDIQVLGLDPQQNGSSLRPRIGVQLQESALSFRLKVWEALDLFASFYSHSVNWQDLMIQLGLEECRNTAYAKLSGGQKQRLFIALALINDPELIFLDELTTGLDPQARHTMWDMVREIRDRGKTIFLTTHFMEEAERLCDRVAIINCGKIVAIDSPESLIQKLEAENRVVFIVDNEAKSLIVNMNELPGVSRIEQIGDRIVVHGRGDKLVVEVVNFLSSNGVKFRDLRTEQANLEDVFLRLTDNRMKA